MNRKKLDEIRIGPYRIKEKISNSIFKLDTGNKRDKFYYHVSKFVPGIAPPNTTLWINFLGGRYKEIRHVFL